MLLTDVPQQNAVTQNAQLGIVDAGECLKAFGMGLAGTGAQNDLVVEDDGDAGQVRRGAAEGVGKVFLGVGGVGADGPLRAGEDDGLGTGLDEIAQGGGGIGHGVRAVGEDKAVVAVVILADTLGDLEPVPGLHIGAVHVQQLHTVYLANLREGRDQSDQLPGGQLGGKAAGGQLGGNGAPGADQEYFFHKGFLLTGRTAQNAATFTIRRLPA